MYKLNYFVPPEHKEKTKEALFTIGLGKYDNYEKCSWESLGMGQFQPRGGAQPYIGKMNQLEILEEYKVEMLCPNELINKAVATLKAVHPYEEVAYEVLKIEEF